MPDEKALAVRVIVVDEMLLDDLLKVLPGLRAKFPNAHLALGFRKIEIAARLVETVKATPSIGQFGFLPMNVEIDCWLSILRLLVWDDLYVPASLMSQVQQAPALRPDISVPELSVAQDPDISEDAEAEISN